MPLVNLNKKLDRIDRGYSRGYSSRPKKNFKRTLKKLIVLFIILFVALYLPLRGAYSSAKSLSAHAKLASAAFKNENLDDIRTNVKAMNADAAGLNRSLNFMIYLSVIPYFGGYYLDAKHFSSALTQELSAVEVLADGLDPYKNELGFTGSPRPGQDKVSQMVAILGKVLPNLDKVTPQLKSASDEVSSVDVNKYPQNLGKLQLRSEISTAKNFIMGGYLAATQYKDALDVAPQALGDPNAKNYLILFQNDKELRGTGGFMTAYAFINLDKGHMSSTGSDDIYKLDEDLLNVCKNKICPLTPPDPIVKYLPEADGRVRGAWSMRDSNLSPDLPTSMKQFETMYSYLGKGISWDGIITIDTEVVRQLITITGPIVVDGTTYSADTDKRCNCPNVVYELENYSENVAKGQAGRKAILGTLMQQVLSDVLNQSTNKLPQFVSTAADLAAGKHMMFYMHDQPVENALSKLNWTGEIKGASGDYLAINDSNFAGGKSNLYVKEDVTLDIDKSSGKHTLTIVYSNPQAYTTWLNAINRDYFRVYVPKGSTLTYSKGSQVAVGSKDDLGKTYFDGFIQIRPQNSLTVKLQYTTPQSNYGDPYPVLIQKQPGTKDFSYTLKVNGKTKAFNLTGDQDLKL